MAWLRTATALIGFGFTIVQFFQHLGQMANVRAAARPELPRYLGLTLIAAGTTALILALWQYHAVVRYLSYGAFAAVAEVKALPHRTPLYLLGVFLGLIGLFAFLSVLLRLA